MNEYTPFLKLKRGELTALKNLLPEDRNKITPLLELPRDEKYTEEKLVNKITQSIKYMEKYIESNFSFYIDNYEVPDEIKLNNKDKCSA